MMNSLRHLFLSFLVLSTTAVFCQHVEITGTNKNIAVSADATVEAEPELAILHLAFSNFARTKEEAFQINLATSNQILAKLAEVGVKKEQIESDDLSLDRAEPMIGWTATEKSERQFKARQAWKIRVPVSKAESTVQTAVKAGVNESSEPDWDVANRSALQAKASAAALERARTIAEEMAKGLGAQLGKLVYASNNAPALTDFMDAFAWGGGRGGSSMSVEVQGTPAPPPPPKLQLFPQKVKQDATVYAVFAIE